MKRTLTGLLCLLAMAAPVAAQDDAPCEIDVVATVSLLVEAQGLAAGGDTAGALEQIAQAQEDLAALEAQCGDGDDVIVTPVELALTQTATIERSGERATVSYPEGWVINVDAGDVMVASAPDILERNFDGNPPPMSSGEALIFIGLTTPDSMGFDLEADASVMDVLEGLSEQVPPEFGEVMEPVTMSVNDRPAGILIVEGEDASIMIMTVQLPAQGDELVFGQLLLLTAPGELNAYENVLQSVAETIRLKG